MCLLGFVPRQAYLTWLLGLREVRYAHVPLVLSPDGQRLAKRHGVGDAAGAGVDEPWRGWRPRSGSRATAREMLDEFDPGACRREPTVWILGPE